MPPLERERQYLYNADGNNEKKMEKEINSEQMIINISKQHSDGLVANEAMLNARLHALKAQIKAEMLDEMQKAIENIKTFYN